MQVFTVASMAVAAMLIVCAAAGTARDNTAISDLPPRMVRPTCGEAFLPTDLSLITEVEQTDVRELHLHGDYRIGHDDFVEHLGGLTRNLTLFYTEKTEFRLAMFPLDAAKLGLTLYDDKRQVVTKSLHGGERIERMIFAILQPNVTYTIVMVYSLGFGVATKCPKVTLEVAAQPTRMAAHFSDACSGAEEAIVIPSILPVETSNPPYYYEYSSTSEQFVYVGKESGGTGGSESGSFSVLNSYPVTIPSLPGHHGKWKLRALVHANFIDGGDIVLVLTQGNSTKDAPTPERCAANDPDSPMQCYYGARSMRNIYVLQEALWPGTDQQDGQYVLWLVRRKAERNLDRTCAPVQLTIQLHPLKESETFINCDVDPLPETFNAPGMYNNETGVLRFNADVLVNLTVRAQNAKITTSKKRSLLRMWVSNHNSLDVDLVLYKGSQIVAASMAYSGPEGIIYELERGVEYTISATILSGYRRYTSTDHDYYEFCDSFELQVHVFPISTANSEATTCSKASAPELGEYQKTLNSTGEWEFGAPDTSFPPYAFPIDKGAPIQQYRIFKDGIKFYLAKTTFFSALVSADTYGGTPLLMLTMQGSKQVLYSRTRTVGQEIYAELQQGWYRLDMMTPYVQRTGEVWSSISSAIPTCIRYNFRLRFSARTSCLSPLELPSELWDTANQHHHLFDEYRVPIGGTHFLAIAERTNPSSLHVKIGWTDAPVTMKVYEGGQSEVSNGAPVATSITLAQWDPNPEIFFNLKANQAYTLVFNFDLTNGASTRCQTFQLQLALLDTPPAPPTTKCESTEGFIDLGQLSPPIDLSTYDIYKPSTTVARRSAIVIRFSLNATAYFRMMADHDFTVHSMALALCACADPTECREQCVGPNMYFNGNEIPRKTLEAGDYSLEFIPWSTAMVNGRDLESDCARLHLRFVVSEIKQRKTPDLCPRSMQYLPRSLNRVGMLNRYYGEETHFLQHVLVNQKHFVDESTFTIGSPSLIRVFSPATGIGGSMIVMGADRQHVVALTEMGRAMYAVLPAGSYILSVSFSLMWSDIDKSTCTYVPLEVAITKQSSLTKLAEAAKGSDVETCANTHTFPTTMDFHGHDTLYRKPGAGIAFNKIINFSVVGTNGNVDVDIRSNFEVAGLAAVVEGEAQSADQGKQHVVYLMKHYPDRAFLNTALPPGTYRLVIFDPVGYYSPSVPLVACTPYSLHLRLTGGGHPPATITGAPGKPPSTVPPPSVRPHLDCDYYQYDVLPTQLTRPADSNAQWFSVRGKQFEIPFAQGHQADHPIPGNSQLVTRVQTTIVVFPGDFVRVWTHTEASVTGVRLRLFHGDNPAPIATGVTFGARTQSLAVKPVVDGDSATLKLEMTFYYRAAPQYKVDYRNCMHKMSLTTYELFMAVFPQTRMAELAACPTPVAEPWRSRTTRRATSKL
jgi:hypothetical protein